MADKLTISKINESALRIRCDSGIAQELSDFFSFYVPGYKFMPAYRNRVWDGRIRLYNAQSQELPVGLFTYVTNFCAKRNYLVETETTSYGSPWDVEEIDEYDLKHFLKNLNLPFEVRDYQYDAIKKALRVKRAILLSPTGSGKSLIIYALSQWVKGKVLVIVPTTSLVEQMHSDFSQYGYDHAHKIYSGKDKNTDERIIITTWQSVYKFHPSWFADFEMVIGDECHGFKSKSLTTLMNKCVNTAYRIGTTGTLDGTQTHKLVLEGLFGRVFNVTTTKDLQDNDTLAKLKINILELGYSDDIRKDITNKKYQEELDYIVTFEKRNKFLTNLAVDQKGNTLVLFQYVEKHGKVLYDMIRKKVDSNRKVFFVSGETATADREAIRNITESQTNAIVVASMGVFSTGVNIRNLHNIVFSSPSKSQIRVLQSIGRGLRKADDGSATKLFDIVDDMQWKSKKNYVYAHGQERIKIYDRERFEYKKFPIPLC